MNAYYLRQKLRNDNADWQILRGGIGVNTPLPVSDVGVHANIDVKSLNVDEWRNLARGPAFAVASKVGNSKAAPNTQSSSNDFDFSAYIEPQRLTVQADELFVMGKNSITYFWALRKPREVGKRIWSRGKLRVI